MHGQLKLMLDVEVSPLFFSFLPSFPMDEHALSELKQRLVAFSLKTNAEVASWRDRALAAEARATVLAANLPLDGPVGLVVAALDNHLGPPGDGEAFMRRARLVQALRDRKPVSPVDVVSLLGDVLTTLEATDGKLPRQAQAFVDAAFRSLAAQGELEAAVSKLVGLLAVTPAASREAPTLALSRLALTGGARGAAAVLVSAVAGLAVAVATCAAFCAKADAAEADATADEPDPSDALAAYEAGACHARLVLTALQALAAPALRRRSEDAATCTAALTAFARAHTPAAGACEALRQRYGVLAQAVKACTMAANAAALELLTRADG